MKCLKCDKDKPDREPVMGLIFAAIGFTITALGIVLEIVFLFKTSFVPLILALFGLLFSIISFIIFMRFMKSNELQRKGTAGIIMSCITFGFVFNLLTTHIIKSIFFSL